MTLNDIKLNALQLMFANYEDDISAEDTDDITNAEYKRYTVNMNGCINRALGRIQKSGVLADKRFEITASTTGTVGTALTRYDLSALISDFYAVKRIIRENDSRKEYAPTVDFTMEGDTLVIANLQSGEKYIVLYQRKIAHIALNAASNTTVDVPDYIAEIIPYFIKADLYEEDEAKLATQARNIFEASLEDLRRNEYAAQNAVVDVFGGLA